MTKINFYRIVVLLPLVAPFLLLLVEVDWLFFIGMYSWLGVPFYLPFAAYFLYMTRARNSNEVERFVLKAPIKFAYFVAIACITLSLGAAIFRGGLSLDEVLDAVSAIIFFMLCAIFVGYFYVGPMYFLAKLLCRRNG